MKTIKATKITDTKRVENPLYTKKQTIAAYSITFFEKENQLKMHYTANIELYNNGAIECGEIERVTFSKCNSVNKQYFKYDDLPNRYKRALREFFRYGNMIFSGIGATEDYSNAIIANMYKNLYNNYVSADINIYM